MGGLSDVMSPEMIPALSVQMASAKVTNQVGTAILAKTLDTAEAGGAALVDMMKSSMERSVNPSVGGRQQWTATALR